MNNSSKSPHANAYARDYDNQGFTIVELLIVVVIIAILAAITVVAYNGMRDKAQYALYRSDIETINKAILLFSTDNGFYPTNGVPSAGSCVTNEPNGTGNFILGLAPTYIAKIPSTPNGTAGANYYAYCWTANGTDYKVIRLVPGSSVPAAELAGNTNIDPARGNRGWGYWSAGGSGL